MYLELQQLISKNEINLIYDSLMIFNGYSFELGILQRRSKKVLWVHICAQDLTGVAISINKWWKTRYPEYKFSVVSNKEFEQIKTQEQQQQQ